MAVAETHEHVGADLRVLAGTLRAMPGDRLSDSEALLVAGYEIAAGLHGIAAALHRVAETNTRRGAEKV